MTLYPLRFKPIRKPKIWGAESWEISGFGEDVSVVKNGYLCGNDLNDLVETYMDELVGGRVYERYGNRFPLLFKFIDAQDDLSIQVHPDDKTAAACGLNGKTEMWYVMDSDENASVVLGFAKNTGKDEFVKHLDALDLPNLLQTVNVTKGDVAYIPAGLVHALRRGTMVAEIQQSSDTTFRIYDYDRRDAYGNHRELHIDQALNVMDYHRHRSPLVAYSENKNTPILLVKDSHFTTNLLTLNQSVERDFATLDSFVVYMCVAGRLCIECADVPSEPVCIRRGESVLIPASLNDIRLTPKSAEAKVLETYIV